MKKVILPLIVGLLVLTGCSYDGYTDQSMRTLRYEAGASEGGDFEACLQPGEKLVTNDNLYPYPVSQREDVWDTDGYWDTNGNGVPEGPADQPDLEVSVDGVNMSVKMKIAFFLNTSCEPVTVGGREYKGGTLQVFHELIGKTRKSYFSCDDDGCSYGAGWLWAMTNYISGPAQQLAITELNKYSPEELWQKTELWPLISEAMTGSIQSAVDANMETDLSFYERMRVNITKITPDEKYRALYRERQEADTRAQTAEQNRDAKIAEAKADAAVAEERAKELEAKIRGAGGPQWYWCGEALKAGKDCFVPNGQVMIQR